MRYLSTSVTANGVSYAYTPTGVGFSYLLSAADDLWLDAHLPTERLRPFMRRYRIKDVGEFDFTHLLLIPDYEIIAASF